MEWLLLVNNLIVSCGIQFIFLLVLDSLCWGLRRSTLIGCRITDLLFLHILNYPLLLGLLCCLAIVVLRLCLRQNRLHNLHHLVFHLLILVGLNLFHFLNLYSFLFSCGSILLGNFSSNITELANSILQTSFVQFSFLFNHLLFQLCLGLNNFRSLDGLKLLFYCFRLFRFR